MPQAITDLYAQSAALVEAATPAQRGGQLNMVLQWLEQTQWRSAAEILEYQMRELDKLLLHAYATVPFYRKRLNAAGFTAGAAVTPELLGKLPLLTRRDVQSAGARLATNALPARFGRSITRQTSGSSGEPVKVTATALDQLTWEAITLRDHQWQQRDFGGKLASIRVFVQGGGEPPDGTVYGDWGPPANYLYNTGPGAFLSLDADVDTQVRWLLHHDPDYLITYPTNLAALIRRFRAMGERPANLKQVRSVGETVPPVLRAACLDFTGSRLADVYSSQEVGYIALQCPTSEQYHVMAEDVLVEILDADNAPCKPGHTGRVVVTSLHNYAMPLIRYELRDHAEAGSPCGCGRGLPTILRILGRTRNMVTLPNGAQHWPVVGYAQYREIAPVRQFQLIQQNLHQIEVRLVTDRPLNGGELAALTRTINTALGHEFRLNFVSYQNEIPRAPGGKFEEFISRLPA